MEPTERILKKIIDLKAKPENLVCYCAGFELGTWRAASLSRHLIAWLPAAVLRPDEHPAHIGDWNAAARKAAFRFFQDVDPNKRGELGELLLHAICRIEFDTHPTLAKMFYKSATNDVVKGFDIVHSKYFEETDEIEIWLGEAKFFSNGRKAARAAVKSIREHLEQWPAPGSEDTELGVLMEPEVRHGEAEVYTRVQA